MWLLLIVVGAIRAAEIDRFHEASPEQRGHCSSVGLLSRLCILRFLAASREYDIIGAVLWFGHVQVGLAGGGCTSKCTGATSRYVCRYVLYSTN